MGVNMQRLIKVFFFGDMGKLGRFLIMLRHEDKLKAEVYSPAYAEPDSENFDIIFIDLLPSARERALALYEKLSPEQKKKVIIFGKRYDADSRAVAEADFWECLNISDLLLDKKKDIHDLLNALRKHLGLPERDKPEGFVELVGRSAGLDQ